MALLTAEQILQAKDLFFEDVDVPEWGGTVRVQGLTAADRDAWETSMFGADGETRNLDNARAKLVARCAADEEGNLLFTEADMAALGKKSAKALDRVFAVCKSINGIGKEDLDELVGNSEGTPSEDSTSG